MGIKSNTLNLTAISLNVLHNFVDYLYENDVSCVQITLTDGTTVCGCIQKVYSYNSDGERVYKDNIKNNCLELYYGQTFNEHSIYIPASDIAGLNALQYKENYDCFEDENRKNRFFGFDKSKSSTSSDCSKKHEESKHKQEKNEAKTYEKSIYHSFFEKLIEVAKQKNFQIKRHFYQYSLGARRTFVWKDIELNVDTPLYSDWSYLERISKGLNSIGVGFMVSLSAGWDNSLWALFKKKTNDKKTQILDAKNMNEAVLEGHVHFIERYTNFPLLEKTVDYINMEGSNWLPAVICTNKVKNIYEIEDKEWVIAYFRSCIQKRLSRVAICEI